MAVAFDFTGEDGFVKQKVAETVDLHAVNVRTLAGNGRDSQVQHDRDRYIKASWNRCLNEYGLVPEGSGESVHLDRPAFEDRREQHGQLLRIARMEMRSLYEQIARSHYVLLLIDIYGLVLERVCDPEHDKVFRSVGLAPGYFWDERHQGTNGPGTCLHERRSLTVHRDEHFFSNYSGLSCSAAPIWAADGSLLGALDASVFGCTDSRPSQVHTVALVTMSARIIEQITFFNSLKDCWIMRLNSRAEHIGMVHDALLAIDVEGRICGADSTAPGLLGLSGHDELIGHCVDEIFALSLSDFFSQGRAAACKVWLVNKLIDGRRYFAILRPPRRRSDIPLPTQAGTKAQREHDRRCDSACGERDPAMTYNMWCAEQVVDKDINILLQGETGTGKSTLAKSIHKLSNRRGGPFIAMSCAAIPESLAESELFGYRSGAFTGARAGGMRGKILASDKGTLFLDEIGDMPLALQARLLQVLEEKKVTPLGSTTELPVDLHIVSASNRDLLELVGKGEFRPDLYYRLNGITLTLPPLRERHDREELVMAIVNAEMSDVQVGIEPEALRCLVDYSWPGNIRELSNVVRTALALSQDAILHWEQLPPHIHDPQTPSTRTPPTWAGPSMVDGDIQGDSKCGRNVDDRERLLMQLERHRWNITLTARDLGISRNTLYRRMKRCEIPTIMAGKH